MRRSRSLDRWLLGTLLPAYLLIQAAGIEAHRASGFRALPFSFTGAQGAEGHPIVSSSRTPMAAVRPGDHLLRLGQVDLRGLSRTEVSHRAIPLRKAGSFEVELKRDGTRLTAAVEWFETPTGGGRLPPLR
jgi:hypothetical protein